MRHASFRWTLVIPICALLLYSSGCSAGEIAEIDGRVEKVLESDPVTILETYPYDGQIVWETLEGIVVTFSSPMNTTSICWDIWPETTDFDLYWSQNDTILTLDPVEYLHWENAYYVHICYAEDKEGNALTPGPVPNPWSFYLDPCPVHITYTSPPDGASGVPLHASIWVLFSVCMDPYSLNWTIEPFIELTPVWDDYYMDLTFVHESPFQDCRRYTIEVDATDYGGRGLDPGPVPNPWSFTTQCTPEQWMTDVSSNEVARLPDDMFRTDFDEPLVEIGPPPEDGGGMEDFGNVRAESEEDGVAEGAVLEADGGPNFRDSSVQDLAGGKPAEPMDDDIVFCPGGPPARWWLVQTGLVSLCVVLFLFVALRRRGRPA